MSIDVSASGIGSEAVGVRATGFADVTIETSEIDAQGGSSGFAIDAFGSGNVIRVNASMVSGANGALSNIGGGGGGELIMMTGGTAIGGMSSGSGGILRCAAVYDGSANQLRRQNDCTELPEP